MEKESIMTTLTFGEHCPLWKLPDQLLVEIFIRVPIADWGHLACVSKYWASLFREEYFWNAALIRCFPLATQGKTWPGPIPRGMSQRRFAALHLSKCIFSLEHDELSEIVGHTYLFLKERLEVLAVPSPSGILHGTIIDARYKFVCGACMCPSSSLKFGPCELVDAESLDQFISCGTSRDKADELASLIWVAAIENLKDNHQTFFLLQHLAFEEDVFLPYPYLRSYKVHWKTYERLFTDFRDCLNQSDYYDLLVCAKQKFHHIPATWLGF